MKIPQDSGEFKFIKFVLAWSLLTLLLALELTYCINSYLDKGIIK